MSDVRRHFQGGIGVSAMNDMLNEHTRTQGSPRPDSSGHENDTPNLDELVLAEALIRVVRPILNGHPAGHDAIFRAKTLLCGLGYAKRLKCNCRPCVMRRLARVGSSPSAEDKSARSNTKKERA